MSEHEIKIQLSGLIQLLANNLYADPDVFVREMIQNANDSIVRRHESFDDKAPKGRIDIHIDPVAGIIRFRDNGAGLTEQELHDYLSTIGRSGTGELKQALRDTNHASTTSLIGQFGIGLLAAFTAAHRIEVRTRSCQVGSRGLLWVSAGEKTYQVDEIKQPDVGSEVSLFIKETHRDMLDAERIRQAVRLYADFIPIPIHLNHDPVPCNTLRAPWDREGECSSETQRLREYQRFIDQRVPDSVMEVIPVVVNQPLRVRGVLYISSRRTTDFETVGSVDLYISRLFIAKDHGEILPNWAKFVRGVIECPDLNPNAARDNITKDAQHHKLQQVLGQVVIDHLKALSERDPAKLIRLLDYHHFHIKGMALENEEFFDAIADLVPFETNESNRTLPEYLGKQRNHPVIRYFSERGAGTQIYLLCNAQGMEVINGSFNFEQRFLSRYAEKHKIRIERLDIAGSKTLFPSLDEEEAERFVEFEKTYAYHLRHLNVHPVMTAFEPKELPVVLTASKSLETRKAIKEAQDNEALPQAVRELLKNISKTEDDEASAPLTLYVNTRNDTVQLLNEGELRGESAQLAMIAMYNNAVMMSSNLQTPNNAYIIASTANRVLHQFVKQGQDRQADLKELERLRNQTQVAAHVTCFVAIPFAGEQYQRLLETLQWHFGGHPYFWEILRADKRYAGDSRENIDKHLRTHMSQAHVFFAEISEANPNVMIEVGRMQMLERVPLYYLQWQEGVKFIADLTGQLLVKYDAADLHSVIDNLERINNIHQIRGEQRFLDLKRLHRQVEWQDLAESTRSYVQKNCHTLESILNASDIPRGSSISRLEWRLLRMMVENIAKGMDIPAKLNQLSGRD